MCPQGTHGQFSNEFPGGRQKVKQIIIPAAEKTIQRQFAAASGIVFRIPCHFALPQVAIGSSPIFHTQEHRVGEHAGFGVGDLVCSAAQ